MKLNSVIKKEENVFLVNYNDNIEVIVDRTLIEKIENSDWKVLNLDYEEESKEFIYNTTYDRIYFPLDIYSFLETYHNSKYNKNHKVPPKHSPLGKVYY